MIKTIRACFFVLGLTGIVLHIMHTERLVQLFSYYTMQSNLFVVLLWGLMLRKNHRKTSTFNTLHFIATVGITITFLVYHFLLVPVLIDLDINYPLYTLNDLFVHYITPWLMIIDYVLLTPKNRLRITRLFSVVVFPIAYMFYVIGYQSLGGRYIIDETVSRFPYFFMDIDQYGVLTVTLYSLLILSGFIISALILEGIKYYCHKIPMIGRLNA